MPKIGYINKGFAKSSIDIIETANQIIDEYAADGLDLTLRQLYYQFVARDLLANNQKNYNRLGSIISDARLAGLVDWNAIVDRTRNLRENGHWANPAQIIDACARSFQHDKWEDQPNRVEVWIEKDALVGVLESACPDLDVPYFACRGYTSQSEMWRAAMRFNRYINILNQSPIIIHLGDHDPSGVDMTRDIQDRMDLFVGEGLVTVDRIALNRDQIDAYNPPPNPAKLTDSRAQGYIAEHGRESWELDALEPRVLIQLIRDTVAQYRDDGRWRRSLEAEREDVRVLEAMKRNWEEIRERYCDNGD